MGEGGQAGTAMTRAAGVVGVEAVVVEEEEREEETPVVVNLARR